MGRNLILYNSRACNGRGHETAAALLPFLHGESSEWTDVLKIGSWESFFAPLTDEDTVFLCGGDGTLNHFLHDTKGLQLPKNLFFFPAGSGNDFMRDLGRTREAGPISLQKNIKELPTVTINGAEEYPFVNGVGFGIDGDVCEEADRRRIATPGAKIDYTRLALEGLLGRFSPYNATVRVDGVEIGTFSRVWLASAMFGKCYGAGMLMAPAQNRFSEKHTLSLVLIHSMSRLKTLFLLPTLKKGTHIKKFPKNVTVMTGRELEIVFDRPCALQLDGETVLNVTSYKAKY